MSFLSPLTIVALALLALPVFVHLLVRGRARRLDFPTLRFLREIPSSRLRPSRLQQPFLLLLRLLALALLIAGLARPLITLHSTTERTRIILLDASFSMKASGRADAARAQARSIINKLAKDERACLIAFSSAAFKLSQTTSDKMELLKAADFYQPASAKADYRAAFAMADELLRQQPPGAAEIDLISDFQEADFMQQQKEFSTRNAATIVAFPVGVRVERNAFLRDEAIVAGEDALTLSASEMMADADGQSGARRSWKMMGTAGEAAGIEWHTELNGQVTGRLKTTRADDDFAADDERFFALTPAPTQRALLIETDADSDLYLSAALAATAATGESVDNVSRFKVERRRVLPPSADELRGDALVIVTLVDAPRIEDLRVLTDYARGGGTVWLLLSREMDVAAWNAFAQTEEGRALLPFASLAHAEPSHDLSFAITDADAPALRELSENSLAALRAVNVRAGFVIEPRQGTTTLMRWNNHAPALAEARTGTGRVLVLATSPERAASDLGLSQAFPALVASIWNAASLRPEPLSQIIGEPLKLDAAPETSVRVIDAEGRETLTQARTLIQNPLSTIREAGIYRLEYDGRTRVIAFNPPVKESECALAGAEGIREAFVQKNSPTGTGSNVWMEATEQRQNAWRYFLAAAWLLLLAELFIVTRQNQNAGVR
jgi:hypothetical protein